jgi:hypothetical protein
MYTSCVLLYALLGRIRSRASGAVTMDLPARCARFTMVTRGRAASGGGRLPAASPGAVAWQASTTLTQRPTLSVHLVKEQAAGMRCREHKLRRRCRVHGSGPAHCRRYLTQPRFSFRDRSRMPSCPLAPGTPFALQAAACMHGTAQFWQHGCVQGPAELLPTAVQTATQARAHRCSNTGGEWCFSALCLPPPACRHGLSRRAGSLTPGC